MPTPSSRMVSLCSYNSQSMPRARNISAAVKPPIPPPTIIAFIAQLHSTPDATQRPVRSHAQLLGRKRLCRLRLQFGPGLRFGLNFKLLEILTVADAVAEDLLLARQILPRAIGISGAIPGRGLHRKTGIDQVRPAQCDEIGAAGGQDGVDLIRCRDVADAHRCNAGLVADLFGERRLEHSP